MVWRRLPTFLPNLPIRLLPFSEAQQKEFEATGYLRTVTFRTIPSLGKLDIKALLSNVYGLQVEKVRTLNVEGKKKRTKYGYHRKPDWKKAYVTLKNPSS